MKQNIFCYWIEKRHYFSVEYKTGVEQHKTRPKFVN